MTTELAANQNNKRGDLKALVAAHPYVSGGATLGATLDQQALAAIVLGEGSSELMIKEAAEEEIQTIVFRYAFHSNPSTVSWHAAVTPSTSGSLTSVASQIWASRSASKSLARSYCWRSQVVPAARA